MRPDPIVITGMGIVSALGNNVQSTLHALKAGYCGIGTIRYLDTEHREFPVGEVQLSNVEMETILGISGGIPTTRTALMGMIALDEAVAMASLKAHHEAEDEIAFISGTTVGGMDRSEQHYLDFLSGDSFKHYIATHDCGACSEMIASRHKELFSLVATPSTACSSAANAIILGANLLRSQQCDIVVAGGSECITKFHLNGFNALMILDHEPCRPFDADRAGLNLGEGSAYLVLEHQSHALKRGAKPIVQLAGWGNACDAFHQTASSDNGEGAYRAMAQAIERAGLTPHDVKYINAHGTGTPNNDLSETRAMQRLFGKSVPPVSSTKSATGHTTSASGSIESVITLLAMTHDFIPGNLHFTRMIENGITPVSQPTVAQGIDVALCNSFGFGGNDSSLLFKKILS
ncbi:MAG: beta-ketoacyl-[acyl-carrier-protein] synthase family protein [Clostridiales bacterium]|nr:beta-ketoacyl-[acyl-carrier-protein] synthase family protein [Clostridiales bacterium]